MALGKMIVFSGPSGSGKSTLARFVLSKLKSLAFSVSACTRAKREGEIEGQHYYFLSLNRFKSLIEQEAFIEYEEVYENHFYGTLQSEVNRLWNEGKTVIFDIDVYGALNIKKQFGANCLSVLICPPDMTQLEKRLRFRSTETEEKIKMRLEKAKEELSYKGKFDQYIINDAIETSKEEVLQMVSSFIGEAS